MSSPKLSLFLVSFSVFFLLLQLPAFAVKKSYIVYLGSHAHGLDVSKADLERVANSHYDFLGSLLGSKVKAQEAIFYSYRRHINGFAATLEEGEAAEIAKRPEVVSVFPNEVHQLHTSRSWGFMSLENNDRVIPGSLWTRARFGEDTIIANLDSGVWPESESFSDEGYGPVPSRWKGGCQNDTKEGVPCNRKIIGSRFYNKGFVAFYGKLNDSENTPRDLDGHGSHTLSTAGGNFVNGATMGGAPNATFKGGSPRARVAAYKVCWYTRCSDADILAGFDRAIHDGVDVISVSLGGPEKSYFNTSATIGAFHAVKNGIIVVCSAGNSAGDYISNVAPWIITVGASTIDREFESFVELQNGLKLEGRSLSQPLPEHKFYPLISGAQAKLADASSYNATLCLNGTLDPEKVKGKIVACLRGEIPRVYKGLNAAQAGAVGMILCNDNETATEILPEPHFLPTSHINYKDGLSVFAYINSSDNPMAYITTPVAKLFNKPAPVMAPFSSLGPNRITPEILKPDITAPGVDIVAAYTGAVSPTSLPLDTRRVAFTKLSGTSMSCPHVSGVAGLLRTLYPNWSPAAIRSALMTTAIARDNTGKTILNASMAEATPFSYGSGHIRPNQAMNPGLVYDLTTNDYLDFLCAMGYNQTSIEILSQGPYKCPESGSPLDLNYPSIAVPKLSGSVTITRKLKNVGIPGTYAAIVRKPVGISVTVEPSVLRFEKIGDEKSFKVTIKAKWEDAAKEYVFGELTWTDRKHYVRSPIAVAAASKN
ncbi:hypothetical protein DITRI_Ditri09bG0058700 [Diplodiscus trichospermus]